MNMHSIYNAIETNDTFEYKIWADSNHIAKQIIVKYHRCCFTRTKSQILMRHIWEYIFYYVIM